MENKGLKVTLAKKEEEITLLKENSNRQLAAKEDKIVEQAEEILELKTRMKELEDSIFKSLQIVLRNRRL